MESRRLRRKSAAEGGRRAGTPAETAPRAGHVGTGNARKDGLRICSVL